MCKRFNFNNEPGNNMWNKMPLYIGIAFFYVIPKHEIKGEIYYYLNFKTIAYANKETYFVHFRRSHRSD